MHLKSLWWRWGGIEQAEAVALGWLAQLLMMHLEQQVLTERAGQEIENSRRRLVVASKSERLERSWAQTPWSWLERQRLWELARPVEEDAS